MRIRRVIRRLLRLLLALVLVLVVLALLGGLALGALVTVRALPQTSGTLKVPGLHSAATVTRDANGIIQIVATDPHDLFLAQGYVHAQERMWQMEISRRIGAGRLSELFGKSEVDTDRFIRTLGWRQAAAIDLQVMAPDVQAALQAYADGVNAWIDQHNGSLSMPFVVAGLLSGKGSIGGIALEHWTPLDSATWQKVQAWSLGGNESEEIFRLLADARLGDPAKTDALFPPYDTTAPVITPTGLAGSGGAGAPKAVAPKAITGGPATATAGGSLSPGDGNSAGANGDLSSSAAAGWTDVAALGTSIAGLAGFDTGSGLVGSHGVGSNDWVVAGAHSASGKPLLANDPHLGYSLPSVWIMNGLHCRTVSVDCPFDVVGVSFPGDPAVILGHNNRIAWGATNVGPDTEDLFQETPDPADPTHYLFKGASLPFTIRHETIHVAGGPDITLDVRSTGHGPILNDVDKRLANSPLLALRWTTTAEPDRALESFFRIDTARNFDEFRAAFEGYGSPSQNFVYADVDGHIGYVLPGLIPIRTKPNCPAGPGCLVVVPEPSKLATGDRVRDGASGLYEWTGYVSRDKLPWQLDPPSGIIVTANNEPVDAKYPYWMGDTWDPGFRAARISQLLAAHKTGLTAEGMRSIQADTYVLRADTIVPLLKTLDPKPATADGQAVLDRTLSWDRYCDVESLGCAAYMTAELDIERELFDGELGPLARQYVGTAPSWRGTIAVLQNPALLWADPAQPSRTLASAVAAAFDRAGSDLRVAYGDPAKWTWGRLHTITFRESTLGTSGIAPLEWYFNATGRPVAGAAGAIDNTYYQVKLTYPDPEDPTFKPVGFDHTFDVSNGPSYRLTVDMADLDGARIVITTGQSGNPFDAHYEDMIPLWASGQTVPLPFSTDAIAKATTATLTLTP